jgi:hypothetical protein
MATVRKRKKTKAKTKVKRSVRPKKTSLARTMASKEFLNAFRRVIPKVPGADPFVIIGTQRLPGGVVSLCKCQCSRTADCGGGGGGS